MHFSAFHFVQVTVQLGNGLVTLPVVTESVYRIIRSVMVLMTVEITVMKDRTVVSLFTTISSDFFYKDWFPVFLFHAF